MDAEERLRTAIMQGLTVNLPLRLRVAAADYETFERALMNAIEYAGAYHDDGTFVIEPDED